MRERITVRDHSQTCEHGSLWSHWVTSSKAKWWNEPECLGGRAISLEKVGSRLWKEVDAEPDDPETESPG